MRQRSIAFVAVLLAVAMCLCLAGCSKTETAHQSQLEKDEGYYYYESILLDKDEVTDAFKSVSKGFPRYAVCPPEFHVTTEFMPAEKHNSLYGTKVTVHIVGYTYGALYDAEDDVTSKNEGFRVEVSSDDKDMQKLLDSYDKTWHITGSYTEGGKYTEQLDWSRAKPVDITLEGTFGGADSDENFYTTPLA